VGVVCTTRILAVPRRRRVVEVARMIGVHWISCVFVTDAGTPVGIITKQSIIEDVLARGYTGMEITAGDIMRTPILTIDAGDDLWEAAQVMGRACVRHLGVTREGSLVGMLSDYHLARLLPEFLTAGTSGPSEAFG
jgi:signal-transduction protein with cAMP-binding, CBS, and nucleotidyltransferase domain